MQPDEMQKVVPITPPAAKKVPGNKVKKIGESEYFSINDLHRLSNKKKDKIKTFDFSLKSIIAAYCFTPRGYINPMIEKLGEKFYLYRIPIEVFERFKHILLDKEKVIKFIYRMKIGEFYKTAKTSDKCAFCGSKTRFESLIAGYHKHCCVDCAQKNPETKQNIINAVSEKYGEGIINVFQTEDVKAKLRKTNLEKYGCENPSCSPEIKAKIETTTMQNYGVKNPFESETIKQKIRNTNMKNLGVQYPMSSKDVLAKMVKTQIENGNWYNYEKNADFNLYKRVVCRYTEKNLHFVKDIEKRGYDFHLDHKFSIAQGFKENIPPYIIGSQHNLEIISRIDNIRKNFHCSISSEDLFEKVFNEASGGVK